MGFKNYLHSPEICGNSTVLCSPVDGMGSLNWLYLILSNCNVIFIILSSICCFLLYFNYFYIMESANKQWEISVGWSLLDIFSFFIRCIQRYFLILFILFKNLLGCSKLKLAKLLFADMLLLFMSSLQVSIRILLETSW